MLYEILKQLKTAFLEKQNKLGLDGSLLCCVQLLMSGCATHRPHFEAKCQGKMIMLCSHKSLTVSVRAPACTNWQIIWFVRINNTACDCIKSKQRLYVWTLHMLHQIHPHGELYRVPPFWPITCREPRVRHWLKWKPPASSSYAALSTSAFEMARRLGLCWQPWTCA